MSIELIHELLWDALLTLRDRGGITNREVASVALVRFTWTRQQAIDELNKRSLQIAATYF